jgi:D-3-phosphoglycerate dehydrogenase
MFKILTLNNISVKGLDRLPRDRYEVASEISSPDAILVRSAVMHDMILPASVKAIARAGAGTNNIPVAKLSERGIPVFNAPGANANAVKELVLAGMLIAARNLMPAWQFARSQSGSDEAIHKAVEAGKKQFVGFELPGRTLGVVGLGAIGVEVCNAALALGMNVVGYDPDITVERAWRLSSSVQQALSIEDLLRRSDFITFHVPLVAATRGLINEARLPLMKPGAVVLNFSREGVVDDAAVVQALDANRLYAYVCDFPGNLLKDHPRVVTLPHLGASTQEAEENCAVMAAEQLREYLEDGNIRNSVNFPNTRLPRADGFRLAVVNSNVPDMVGQISHALGKASLNIIHMLNESRGPLAYTLLDVNAPVGADTLAAIAAIPGVLSARAV